MQQLRVKLKNVPRDASLVPCSTNLQLNREETLSVVDKVLTRNNPEVNQVQRIERSLQAFVFVLNLQGKPLMPCSYAKSKRMAKSGKARVIKRFPFTIQLNFECENKVQEINLGLDPGFGNIGFSATTEKQELLCGTLILDGKTKDRLAEKRMYRKGRRSRHHWYRKSRFDNRKRKEDWLPPSIERRYLTHLNLISKIKKLLPISNIILEIAKFDIQKIENPDIQGVDYQQGNLYDCQNIRSYLMSREKGKCQLCEKDFKGQGGTYKPGRHGNSMVIHSPYVIIDDIIFTGRVLKKAISIAKRWSNNSDPTAIIVGNVNASKNDMNNFKNDMNNLYIVSAKLK